VLEFVEIVLKLLLKSATMVSVLVVKTATSWFPPENAELPLDLVILQRHVPARPLLAQRTSMTDAQSAKVIVQDMENVLQMAFANAMSFMMATIARSPNAMLLIHVNLAAPTMTAVGAVSPHPVNLVTSSQILLVFAKHGNSTLVTVLKNASTEEHVVVVFACALLDLKEMIVQRLWVVMEFSMTLVKQFPCLMFATFVAEMEPLALVAMVFHSDSKKTIVEFAEERETAASSDAPSRSATAAELLRVASGVWTNPFALK